MKNTTCSNAAIAILASCLGLASAGEPASNKKDFFLVAHRGGVVDKDRSENSLKALDEAARRGYTHVEVDARCTRDGHAVCFHNMNLKDETGVDANISDLTLAEVKKIVLTRSKETIPTFDEYCARCAGRINLMVDIKGVDDQWLEQFTLEIDQALIRHRLTNKALFIINRFPVYNQQRVVDWFLGRSRISWRVSLLRAQILRPTMPDVSKYYFIFNSPADFDPAAFQGFHKMGLKIIASVNLDHYKSGDPMTQGLADIKNMLDWGVDGLQIDSCYDPAVFEWLKKK